MAKKIVLISCSDDRLHNEGGCVAEFCRERGFEIFPVFNPGGVLQLARPEDPAYQAFVLKSIHIGVADAGATATGFLNHTNCKVYPDLFGDAETQAHLADYDTSKLIVTREFPWVPVLEFLAVQQNGTKQERKAGNVFKVYDVDSRFRLISGA